MVCLAGFEPTTPCLGGRCSIRLSYRHIGTRPPKGRSVFYSKSVCAFKVSGGWKGNQPLHSRMPRSLPQSRLETLDREPLTPGLHLDRSIVQIPHPPPDSERLRLPEHEIPESHALNPPHDIPGGAYHLHSCMLAKTRSPVAQAHTSCLLRRRPAAAFML